MTATTTTTADPTVMAVSPPEAARRIGVSRATMYDLLRRGAVPRRKIGTRTVIAVADLQSLLDRAAQGAA